MFEWINTTHIQFIALILMSNISPHECYNLNFHGSETADIFFAWFQATTKKGLIFSISWRLLKFKILAKSYHSACTVLWFLQFFSRPYLLKILYLILLQIIHWKWIANCQTANQRWQKWQILRQISREKIVKFEYCLHTWGPMTGKNCKSLPGPT